MDRIEAFYKQNIAPAQEGAGTVALGAAAALIGAAITKAAIKDAIKSSRMKRYDKEKAAGNVSEKTLANASRYKMRGMTYPEFSDSVEWYQKFKKDVDKLVDNYQKLVMADIKKLLSAGIFKDYKNIVSYHGSGYTKHDYFPYSEVDLCMALSYEKIIECMGDETYEDISSALQYVAGKTDIEAIKNLSMKQLKEYIGAVDKIIRKHLNSLAADLKKLGLPVIGACVDPNSDDVYVNYIVTIRFEKHTNS